MSDGTASESPPDIPNWEDEYVDRVSGRLMHSYDLERDRRVRDHTFDLYGRLDVESRKQFLHPAITYGHHETTEHVFVQRSDSVSVEDLERLADFGDVLADEWIDPDEQHYATRFVFAVVVDSISESVREFISGFESRTLLKHGYYGHYTVRLLAVVPEREALTASPGTDIASAFRLWGDGREENDDGVIGRLRAALSRRS
jgi:hypothetical protein